VHGDLSVEASRLPGVDPNDSEKRDLPSGLSSLYLMGRFAPQLDGRVYGREFQTLPALLAKVLQAIFERVPEANKKWRDHVRDGVLKGINPATGHPVSSLFAEMRTHGANLSRLISNAPPGPKGEEPPEVSLSQSPAATIEYSNPGPAPEPAKAAEMPKDWLREERRIDDSPRLGPGKLNVIDPGEYEPREPWEMGLGGPNFDQGNTNG
jgi:hypothetical protein